MTNQPAAAATIGADGLEQPEYKKLYKQLGTKNNNKDVRKHMQQRLESSVVGQVCPHF